MVRGKYKLQDLVARMSTKYKSTEEDGGASQYERK